MPDVPRDCERAREAERFQFIALPLLERLVAEIDRWPSIKTIWFFHFGEPLAHPEYRKCLEILARSRVASRAMVIQHTNGSLLRGEKAEAILETGIIKKLVFSFDGFGDRASFILRGPHFDQVFQNIRAFAEATRARKPDLRLTTCTILPRPGELPMVETPPREVALRQLHDLFDPLGVTVETRDMHNYSNNDDLPIAGRMPSRVLGGCQFVEGDSLYFTVNGWAQPCCAVYSEQFRIGNIANAGFGDLLNGEPMRQIRRSLRLDRRNEVPHCTNCELSLGGLLGPGELQAFWKARDDQGMIDNVEERRYLFGIVAPTPHRQIRVDLGCGRVKLPGFIGVDRFPLPGVDIVANLDEPLPFADDSVDLVHASHSLEHLRDLSKVIREVYRICKHGAQICIIAPYSQQGLNIANPYHKHAFNEHTPRFWTAAAATPIDVADYYHPHAASWGLLQSDNSTPDIDIRCVKMEFFYFPRYRDLPVHLQRQHRQHEFDICDQVVYHLLVVKQTVSDEDFLTMSQAADLYESPNITIRRVREQCERLDGELHGLSDERQQLEGELHRLSDERQQLEGELHRLSDERQQLEGELHRLAHDHQQIHAKLHRECTRPVVKALVLQLGRRIVHFGRKNREFVAPKDSRRERLMQSIMRFQRRLRGKGASSLFFPPLLSEPPLVDPTPLEIGYGNDSRQNGPFDLNV